MPIRDDVDYAETGMSIQKAMLDLARRFPDVSTRPPGIRWGTRLVRTFQWLPVPHEGRFRLVFFSGKYEPRQGVDVKSEKGGILLVDGRQLPILRSYYTEDLVDEVEYAYSAPRGMLVVWNVYQVRRGMEVIDEKWTGNAGFHSQEIGPGSWRFYCSSGPNKVPCFDDLVFSIEIRPLYLS